MDRINRIDRIKNEFRKTIFRSVSREILLIL